MPINGSLREMSLYNLLEILRAGSKSGVLLITSGDQRGMVYFAEGLVMDALLVRDINPEILALGGDALQQMLLWDDAVFTFDQAACIYEDMRSEQPAKISIEQFDQEDRAVSSRSQVLPKVTLDTHFDLVPQPPINGLAKVKLDMVQWRILSHVSPYQTLREICETTGIDTETALVHVTKLLSIGMLKVISEPSAAVPTQLSAHYYMPALVA